MEYLSVHFFDFTPSSHNHGSVENSSFGDKPHIFQDPIFHFHDYGRKCKANAGKQHPYVNAIGYNNQTITWRIHSDYTVVLPHTYFVSNSLR